MINNEKIKKSILLEGELFCLIEGNHNDEEETTVCAEVAGVNIWDWLCQVNHERIRIKIEVLDEIKEEGMR